MNVALQQDRKSDVMVRFASAMLSTCNSSRK